VKRPGKRDIYRVDVDGADHPFAVLDAKLMHNIEAASAFGDAIDVRWEMNAQGKRVIVKVLSA
jgi:hypothetical protein